MTGVRVEPNPAKAADDHPPSSGATAEGTPTPTRRPTLLKSATQKITQGLEWQKKVTAEATRTAANAVLQTGNNSLAINWEVERYIASRRSAGKLNWQDHVYRALASPGISPFAMGVTVLMLLLSVVSVAIAAVQISDEAEDMEAGRTCPRSGSNKRCDLSYSFISDIVFAAMFSIELLVRLIFYVNRLYDLTLWLDGLTIVPFFIRIGLAAEGLRPLEIENIVARQFTMVVLSVSALRLLRFARYLSGTQLMKRALYDSASALGIPCYLLLVQFTFLGALVFAFEYDPGSEDSGRVTNLHESWWMMLVTMTTVGYGDYSPQTEAGRGVTTFAMLAGLCFTAMPLAIVGNTFSAAWEARMLSTISDQIRRGLLEQGHEASDLIKAFADFDLNHNGEIDYKEFKQVVTKHLNVALDVKKLRKVWKALDADDTGSINYTEFCIAMFPEMELAEEEDQPRFTKPAEAPGAHGKPFTTDKVSAIDISSSSGAAGDVSADRRSPAIESLVDKLERAVRVQSELQETMKELLAELRSGTQR